VARELLPNALKNPSSPDRLCVTVQPRAHPKREAAPSD
jgi:hypothetical protein